MSSRGANGGKDGGGVVRRELHDQLRLSEGVSWTSTRTEPVPRWVWLLGLVILIVAAPVVQALSAESLELWAEVIIGIVVNVIAAVVGFRAIVERVTIRH